MSRGARPVDLSDLPTPCCDFCGGRIEGDGRPTGTAFERYECEAGGFSFRDGDGRSR